MLLFPNSTANRAITYTNKISTHKLCIIIVMCDEVYCFKMVVEEMNRSTKMQCITFLFKIEIGEDN